VDWHEHFHDHKHSPQHDRGNPGQDPSWDGTPDSASHCQFCRRDSGLEEPCKTEKTRYKQLYKNLDMKSFTLSF
jgi:hypothetical protein